MGAVFGGGRWADGTARAVAAEFAGGFRAGRADLESLLREAGDPVAEAIHMGRPLSALSAALERRGASHSAADLRWAVLAVLARWAGEADCGYGRERMLAAAARVGEDPFGADVGVGPGPDPLDDLLASVDDLIRL